MIWSVIVVNGHLHGRVVQSGLEPVNMNHSHAGPGRRLQQEYERKWLYQLLLS